MSAAINCPACNRPVSGPDLTRCAACGAPLQNEGPRTERSNAIETWRGWQGVVAAQKAAISYWFMARQDHARVREALERWSAPEHDPVRKLLAAKLERGLVADPDQLPREVVTIGSRVEFVSRNERGHCVLADPTEKSLEPDAVSPLSPFGAILFGMLEGRSVRAQDTDGASFTLHIQSVQQPETRQVRTDDQAAQRRLAS